MTDGKHGMRTLLLGAVLAVAAGTIAVSDVAALELGKQAPDFSLPGTTGEPISLKQLRGKKIVLLEFVGAAFAPT